MENFNKIFHKINYKKIFLILLIITAFATSGLFIAKKIINYSNLQNAISSLFDIKIELKNPQTKLNFKFNFYFNADEIEIFNKNKSEKFATITKPNICAKPFSLLFNKIDIKNFSAQNIELTIKRDKNGKIELFEILNNKNLDFFFKKPPKISRLHCEIENLKIIFKDNYNIQSNIELNTQNNQFIISKKYGILKLNSKGNIKNTINKETQNAQLNLNISSKYPIKNLTSKDLKTKIEIKDINLCIFNDLIKKFISKDIILYEGLADFNLNTINFEQKANLTIKNQKIKLQNNTIIPYKKNLICELFFDINKDILKINNLKILSNDLNITSFGEISKFYSNNPKISLKTSISNTQLNNFLYFMPDNLIYYNPKGIPTLKKSNFHALLNGELEINYPQLDIKGNLKALNVHIPNYPKTYRQNDVSANFIGDKVNIYTRVYTPQNEYVLINGYSNLDDSLYGKYDVTSTKNIDLAFAQKYLVPIQQIIGFNIGPVPIMDISGFGNINIKTKGTLKDAQIFGTFNARNASAKIDGLSANLTNGFCELVFDNRNLIFKKIKGKIQEADFLLTGIGNTKGEVELNAKINNSRLKTILDIFNNSLISQNYKSLTKNISATSGSSSAEINLKGTIKDYEDENFLSYLDLDGNININNSKIFFNNGAKLNKVNLKLNFGKEQNALGEFNLGNSKFNFMLNSKTPLETIQKDKTLDFKTKIFSNKISSIDIINELKNQKIFNQDILNILNNYKFYTKTNINSQGQISIDNFKITNLKNKGYIIGLNDKSNSNITFKSGLIKFENSKILFDNLILNLSNGAIQIIGDIDNFIDKNPDFNLKTTLNNVNLSKLSNVIPKIKFSEALIKNGEILIKNNNLKLSNISIIYDSLPLFINAQIKDFLSNKQIIANFSTIINETTCDNIINPYLTYPLKIKNEILLKGNIKGNNDNYAIDFLTKIPKNSDMFFSGANLGEINTDRELRGKIEVNQNIAKINNLEYIKHISNQNGKINPIIVLKSKGQIQQINNDYFYNNLEIATKSPINVRILNLIFKKSLLKKGNFECNINLNGNIKTPNAEGKVFLEDLDIPLYNAKINSINFNITKKLILGDIIANSNNSDININLKAQNKLTPPYIINNINVSSNELDINSLLNSITSQTLKNDISPKSDFIISPQDIIIENGTITVKNAKYDKINAQNLNGEFDFKNNIFNLKNSSLNVAQGEIVANGKYNLSNTQLSLNAIMKECDSNQLTKEFLNLSGQIFGKMNGSIKLSGKNLNTPDNIKNIYSNINFSITNGKMPKLGSLEYLLRAGNIVKNGVLGLSLNNIVQVLTPYKTGEFNLIDGKLAISQGKIKDLEIASKGKNLSLYLEGEYDILKNFADIEIYGKLSQNVSNALGAVGNASLKQFLEVFTTSKAKENHNQKLAKKLEKIPEIDFQETTPKFFSVKVFGDINKDNYIKSFNWEN